MFRVIVPCMGEVAPVVGRRWSLLFVASRPGGGKVPTAVGLVLPALGEVGCQAGPGSRPSLTGGDLTGVIRVNAQVKGGEVLFAIRSVSVPARSPAALHGVQRDL